MAMLNGLSSFLHSFFAFIIILVPLVVFHEFGHFVFARIFGVKAEIFSVGFGPTLWSKQLGETELRLSAIPMGGYVKLLGEDRDTELSPEELKRALHKQKAWKRFFIFFGGPLFNFLLAIFLFMVILAVGEPHLASVVGRVVHSSTAEKAGFISGDQILAVDQKPVTKFEEVINVLNDNPGKPLVFSVQHPGGTQPVSLTATPVAEKGYSMYGEMTQVGEIDGLFPSPRANVVGISNPQSLAGAAGIKTGDQVVGIKGRPVTNWEQLDTAYGQLQVGETFELSLERGTVGAVPSAPKETQKVSWVKPVGSKGLGADFGLYSSELFVEKTVPGSPAEKAGLLAGDRLVAVGSQEVQSFFELREAIQKSGEKSGKVELLWEHQGQLRKLEFVPTSTTGRDPILNKTTQFTVGVIPKLVLGEPVTVIERIWNPIRLVAAATERMVIFSWRNLVSLGKMISGDAPMGQLGGPIMIGKIAGESLARGLIVFLTNMAIFSVGLGVLNILPVPILDGGHLVLLGVEMVRGKPLTIRQMEIIQGVGLILILTLMGIAFHNDISRLFYS